MLLSCVNPKWDASLSGVCLNHTKSSIYHVPTLYLQDKANKRRMLMAIDKRKKLLKKLRLVRYDAFEHVCEQLGITYTFPPEYYRRVTRRWLAKKAFCIKVELPGRPFLWSDIQRTCWTCRLTSPGSVTLHLYWCLSVSLLRSTQKCRSRKQSRGRRWSKVQRPPTQM